MEPPGRILGTPVPSECAGALIPPAVGSLSCPIKLCGNAVASSGIFGGWGERSGLLQGSGVAEGNPRVGMARDHLGGVILESPLGQ